MRRWVAATVLAAVGAVGIAATAPVAPVGGEAAAFARQATAAAGLPVVPDPAECTVAPRSLDSVRVVLGDPPPAPAGEAPLPAEGPLPLEEPDGGPPAAPGGGANANPGEPPADAEPLDPELGGEPPVPMGFSLPPGEPADAATTAAVTATVRRFVACANARDVARMYGLVTDAFLRQSFGNQPTTEAVVAYLSATPVARPAAERTELVAVREVRRLPDGRVGALVDDRDPTDPRNSGVTTDWVVFVGRDGGFLMDEYVSGIERFYGPGVTPTP